MIRRNYFAVLAWLLLVAEFATPYAVEYLFPDWVHRLGPGGPYVASYWIAALSVLGAAVAAIGLKRSFSGYGGRVASAGALLAHVLIGAIPVVLILRLLFHLY